MSEHFTTGHIVAVLLPVPLGDQYDYRVPSDMLLETGDYVEVRFGPRKLRGVVWGKGEGKLAASKIRDISKKLNMPPMPEPHRRFVDWVSSYVMAPRGAVLKMCLSVPDALDDPKQLTAYRLHPDDISGKLTAAREKVLSYLAEHSSCEEKTLCERTKCGPSVPRRMAELGMIDKFSISIDRPPPRARNMKQMSFSQQQQEAIDEMCRALDHHEYEALLLDGVTGSGKTEVYSEAIWHAIQKGKQTLVLLPEIALEPQLLARFKDRFGVEPIIWHSGLTHAQRRRNWRFIASGQAQIVIGARSALFLPFANLGLIVVDEEHESAFKQEEGVIYHGRDMAVTRAWLGSVPIVLTSATPSLESMVNGWQGRYKILHLPDRHGSAILPDVKLIDMRDHKLPGGKWVSQPLSQALAETLGRGEQAMLFLNRRGYAPLTLCRSCGHRMQCPHCSAWLVEHRTAPRLQCHHCGYQTPRPEICPQCEAKDSFAACGPGVERIVEEVSDLFPTARVKGVTSDLIHSRQEIDKLINQVKNHQIDILIGTQMIAKGHHFPLVTLVGVIDADLGLAGGDLRAAERSFQLLHQVSGRAGREQRPGRAFIQTYQPQHPLMQALASHDRDGFYHLESQARQMAELPPFERLAALILSDTDEIGLDAWADNLAAQAPRSDDILVLGPAPAPISLLRGRHRRRFLIKAPKKSHLQDYIRQWVSKVPTPRSAKLQIDIDPYGFL